MSIAQKVASERDVMSETDDESVKPWYRQFWFWFVFSPLIYIIIMCSVTVTIALKGADDVIIDNYYKEGRMINQALEQDKRAQALGLSGNLSFDRTSGEVSLTIANPPAETALMPEKLLLLMGHPVKAAKDQLITLIAIAPGKYRGELLVEPDYSWYLTLYPIDDLALRKDAPWTLSGEIDFRAAENTLLAPRVH
ncbi:FixH family protein [Cellvibrio sp. OA-2007]|uniref:FixH family protein n=1 Tax=Cellvibrio sp. OA-2007 TaxID=529823 RepID=UPI000A704426|nr:FixH family protein [Cellvibrio sp. OA-2007]